MSLLKIVFVFGVVAVSLKNVLAVSSEEKEKFHAVTTPYMVECSAGFGVTVEDIQEVEKTDSYGTLNPCIMACFFRKSNMIDDQGLYNAVTTEELLFKFLSDEADRKKASGIISECKSVNEHEVSDGEKGCDRAKLLLECVRPLKAMFTK